MFYGTENGKTSVNIYNSLDFLNSQEKIIEGLKSGNILPSTKLIVWGLAIANIKHFGNDYGLFHKLSMDLNNNGFDNNINQLQITGHREDGKDFLSFQGPTFIYNMRKNGKLQKSNTKTSRVMNIISAYAHLGEKFKNHWIDYENSGEIKKIEFSKIK